MSQTIETGIRIPQTQEKIVDFVEIVKTRNTNHIQLMSSSPENTSNDILAIRTELPRIELSIYMGDISESLDTFLEVAYLYLELCESNRVKFLIIPLNLITRFSLDSEVHEGFAQYLKVAYEKKILICLDMPLVEISTKLDIFDNIDQKYPNTYMLRLSFSIEPLSENVDLNQINLQRSKLALIHVRQDTHNERSSDLVFSKLLSQLYYLPYRQQPLIFTDTIDKLNEVYAKFESTVKSANLWYM